MRTKIIFFANTAWYLYNFRLALAKALRDDGFEVVLVSPEGEFGDRLRAAGFRWEPLPLNRRSVNPFSELKAIFHLYRLFLKERPAVIHNFTVKCVIHGGIAAALAKVPARVNAVAGLGYIFSSNELKARALRPFVRLLLRSVVTGKHSRLILQNRDDVGAFVSRGVADSRYVRLIKGSGVDLTRFSPRDRPLLSGTDTRVLLAARLLWDKGIAVFVEAARILRKEGVPIRFLLAGGTDSGNPAAIPDSILQEWAREGVVEILGHVDDMAVLFSDVDIFALPTWYGEGVPRSLIEAAACALPLVATDIPGCREVISNGIDGLLIPTKDPEALAAAIKRIHDSPVWARALGEAARKKALQDFDERVVISNTRAVYQELGC